MNKNIKKLLREGLFKMENAPAKRRQFKQLHQLVEKKIRVGDNITKKLNRIDTDLSKNLLSFINSDKIKDDATVDYVDYDKKNEKLFTLGYTDQKGNTRERLFKFNKLLSYLGSSIENIKSYEVEELMNHLKQAELGDFKIVDGEDILWAYHCDNYDEGETMGSCMRHEHAQEYLGIFTNNPNQVKCLVLVNPDNNMVRGRALLWTLDDGTKYLDRIYATNSKYNVEYNNYVEEHNIQTSWPGNKTVTLDNGGEYDTYPYMDTFEYYTPYSGELNPGEGELHLQDTHGGQSNGVFSEYHQERIPEDEAAYIEHMEDYVYQNEIEQDFKGDWVFPQSDDVVNITKGSYTHSYALKDDVVKLHDNHIVVDEDAIYIDKGEAVGEYAFIDDTIVDWYGSDILRDEAIELTLGKYEGEYAVTDEIFVVIQNGEVVGLIAEDDDFVPDYDNDNYQLIYHHKYTG